MKKTLVFILICAMLCTVAGCKADVDVNVDGYKNQESKAPFVTGTFAAAETTDSEEDNSPGNTDAAGNVVVTDGSGNLPESSNGESSLPQATSSPSGGSLTSAEPGSSPVHTSSPDTGVLNSQSPMPTGTSESLSTSSPSPTKNPAVTATQAPVITPGTADYVLTVIVEYGGYAYINLGENTATNVNKGWYNAGDYVSVSAVANDGLEFVGWYVGDDFISPDATYNFFRPARDYPLTARFVY